MPGIWLLDFDAWHMAVSAFDLNNSFSYHTSRFPGYPLPEYIYLMFIDFGWIGTNSLTLAITLLGGYYFARLLEKNQVEHREFIIPAYLFCHLIWINSSNSMDYMWAVSFLLMSLFYIFEKKHIASGFFLGLAVGSRITSIFFFLPCLYYLYSNRTSLRAFLHFTSSLSITVFLLFLPLLLIYNLDFLTYYGNDVESFFLYERCVEYFGFWVLIVSVPLVLLTIVMVVKKIKEGNQLFNLSVISSLLIIALFLYKPYEKEYILPAIPFILIICCFIYKRYSLIIFAALILANFHYIPRNIEQRKAQLSYAHKLVEKKFPDKSIVLLGSWFPVFAYLNENVSLEKRRRFIGEENKLDNAVYDFKRGVTFRYILTREELDSYLERGCSIYFNNSANDIIIASYKFNLNNFNTINIDTN